MASTARGTPEERAKLTELIRAVELLEETADRLEREGIMPSYPPVARRMAEEHKAEARALFARGVRRLPVPRKTSAGVQVPPELRLRAADLFSPCAACGGDRCGCARCENGAALTESGKALHACLVAIGVTVGAKPGSERSSGIKGRKCCDLRFVASLRA
ncbi:MAG: hypothetical protein JWM95_2337 [Gemmatimonadetes bacterium]|nr:hypothetical protein [Gemmatimonadota bacterium]